MLEITFLVDFDIYGRLNVETHAMNNWVFDELQRFTRLKKQQQKQSTPVTTKTI